MLLKKYKQVTDHSGLNWYREGNEWCKRVAEGHNLSLVTVCAIVSALSPGTNWEQNKRDALAIIKGKKGYRPTTYGRNVAKARTILKDGVPRFSIKTGPKTYNFFHALVNPETTEHVVIDRHAYVIATGKPYIGVRGKQYDLIAKRYKRAAKKLGILPTELQAVLWVDYRHKENIKFNIDVPF